MSAALFTALCLRYGLPEPVPEYRFAPPRKWRFDYAWPQHWVALEQDGGVWTRGRHTRGAGWLKDTEKFNTAAALGWRVIRCTPQQLTDLGTIRYVARALGYPAPGDAA